MQTPTDVDSTRRLLLFSVGETSKKIQRILVRETGKKTCTHTQAIVVILQIQKPKEVMHELKSYRIAYHLEGSTEGKWALPSLDYPTTHPLVDSNLLKGNRTCHH